ncbi:MAG: hypothetical protein WDM81_01295 [Rhizomicrobium sp.]
MGEAYIVAAARTAGGKRGGKLKDWHPVDLGANVINALLDRSGANPDLVEDVICGCVSQVRPAGNQRRAQCGDGLAPARACAGHLGRPPVRLVAAVAAFRGAGGDVGLDGRGDRDGHREHDARADGRFRRAADAEWHGHPI